jgi:RNA polymerase sigma-70 factor (ECF subfamily)
MDTEAGPATELVLSPASFDAFFRDRFAGVARATALVVRDIQLGEDFAQEAFARLYPRWGAMESEEHARNFVFRVALNLARSHLRRRRLLPFRLRREGFRDTFTEDMSGATAERMAIVEAFGGLSPRQRSCVVLIDYVGYDATYAAEVLGMNVGTVRVHLMRGRRALRERLDAARRKEEA